MNLPLHPGRPILVPQVRFMGPKAARSVDLFLDTGAMFTLLSGGVVREIGLDPRIARRHVSMITANGVVRVPVVQVPAMELAGLRLKRVAALCHDIPELAEAAGLLGLNALEQFVTTLDDGAKRLRLKPIR